MSLFDQIKIKKDLPLPEDLNINWKDYIFQTKDLDNCLLDYFIDEQGELWEEIVERDYFHIL